MKIKEKYPFLCVNENSIMQNTVCIHVHESQCMQECSITELRQSHHEKVPHPTVGIGYKSLYNIKKSLYFT